MKQTKYICDRCKRVIPSGGASIVIKRHLTFLDDFIATKDYCEECFNYIFDKETMGRLVEEKEGKNSI